MAEPGHSSLEAVTQKIGGTSAWAPFREPLFRSLWIASVISYTGTWMQNMGTGWLMTQLTTSPLMVSLVQVAMSLPVFLVALPAGALADMMDRRRLLLVTQTWMVAAAAILGVLTIVGWVTPWVLLLLTFVLGLGAIMNDPAWQAITPDIISHEQHASAVALNSAGYNLARSFGPALAGLTIAAAGSGIAFLLNAASFFGVIIFLYRWQYQHSTTAPAEDIASAIKSGVRYVRHSVPVKAVLVRTGVFSFSASALLALLPIIARPHGSVGYGLLLGWFGLGALAGAAILSQLRRSVSMDTIVALATIIFAAVTFATGRLQPFWILSAVMFAGGGAWISILASLNVAAQTMTPSWMRARALSMYLLVLQGGMAAGSAAWGALASRFGIPLAMMFAALGLLAGLTTIHRYGLVLRAVEIEPSVVRE